MNITPETIARLIYCLHNLRYWEREYDEDLSPISRKEVNKWRARADELLVLLGADNFSALKDLIEEIKIEVYATENTTQENQRMENA
jgi:hypothetical protein